MKKISAERLSELVISGRKKYGMTQQQLAELTGMNRTMLGRVENGTYMPNVAQLEALCERLGVEITDLLAEEKPKTAERMKITVAGVGHVGLSLAVLLAQNHSVTAITTTEAKVELIQSRKSPIQDRELQA